MLVVDLEVFPRDKARVAHVDVDLTLAAVAAYRDAPLPNHVLELAALEPRYRRALRLRIPLHLCRAGRCRLQCQKSPRVALLGTRVRRHSTESECAVVWLRAAREGEEDSRVSRVGQRRAREKEREKDGECARETGHG